jgi:hypothetical protein
MSGRSARTHGDASLLELFADGAPMNAQLGADLAQGPTLGVQVRCTLNVHPRHRNGVPTGGHAQAMTAEKRTGGRAEVLAKIGRGDEQDAARSGWPLPARFRRRKRSLTVCATETCSQGI